MLDRCVIVLYILITRRDEPQNKREEVMEYRGYQIEVKKDFGSLGYFIGNFGEKISSGYVIVKNGANVLPGATWAKDIETSHVLIDIFETAKGDSARFWELHRLYKQGKDDLEREKKFIGLNI